MAYDHEKTPLSECLKIEAALTSDVHSKARLDAWVEHAKLLERDARRYYFLRQADDVPVSFGKQFDEDCDSAMRGSAYDASRPSKATHPQPVTPAGAEVEPADTLTHDGLREIEDAMATYGGRRLTPQGTREFYGFLTGDAEPDIAALLYTHPPVADAAQFKVGDGVSWANGYGSEFPGVVVSVDSTTRYGIRLADGCVVTDAPARCVAALNQRGGGA